MAACGDGGRTRSGGRGLAALRRLRERLPCGVHSGAPRVINAAFAPALSLKRVVMARPKPLADLIDACLGPALAAQGFAASDVIVAWADIVGERLAGFT